MNVVLVWTTIPSRVYSHLSPTTTMTRKTRQLTQDEHMKITYIKDRRVLRMIGYERERPSNSVSDDLKKTLGPEENTHECIIAA